MSHSAGVPMLYESPHASRQLLQLTEATRLLAECKTFDDVRQLRNLAEAAREYARVSHQGLEAQNHAAEIKLRAERCMGEMLRESGIHAGRPDENGSTMLPLKELGITKIQSSRWQQIATLTPRDFETYIDETREHHAELTTAGALRLAREHLRSINIANRQRVGSIVAVQGERDFYTDLHQLQADRGPFGCIYADPPWAYTNQGTRASTNKHYETMTVDEICALPIGNLAAAESHLHLWTTNGFLFECPKIFAAWGFEFKSSFVWVKPHMGIGNYWRNSHELLLLGVRGGLTAQHRGMASWLQAPREAHSQKPALIRDRVKQLSPGPYLELFGRGWCPGWTVWGNECLPTNGRLFEEVVA